MEMAPAETVCDNCGLSAMMSSDDGARPADDIFEDCLRYGLWQQVRRKGELGFVRRVPAGWGHGAPFSSPLMTA